MADNQEKTWGLVGVGTIGGEVADQLAQEHLAERMGLNPLPGFVLRQSGVYVPEGYDSEAGEYVMNQVSYSTDVEGLERPDLLVVALPSDDVSARLAFDLTTWMAEEERPVVTAEKGMLANYWDGTERVTDGFRLLGRNAAVGGGNRLIDVAGVYAQDPENVREIHGAFNGTLTYMLSEMSGGVPVGIAAGEAIKLGYADPLPAGATPMEVIRGEAEGDIPKKTSIFFNSLGLSEETLDWSALKFELDDDMLKQLAREARSRRFIVSIYRSDAEPEDPSEIIGGFNHEHDGWRIVGGFRKIGANPMFDEIASYSGTANGGKIGLGPDNTDGVYPFGGGPGAGPKPTVNTMLDDGLQLLRDRAA